jgi:hypothetical protein
MIRFIKKCLIHAPENEYDLKYRYPIKNPLKTKKSLLLHEILPEYALLHHFLPEIAANNG